MVKESNAHCCSRKIGDRSWADVMSEVITASNFPKLTEDIKPLIYEAVGTAGRINTKKITTRHSMVIVSVLQTKRNENILEIARSEESDTVSWKALQITFQ